MSVIASILIMAVVAVGLIVILGCAYWVMSGPAVGGSFRDKAQNLKTCPQCGATLDSRLDHCPQCSLRVSV